MRRDANDRRWKAVKDEVYARDGSRCRLMKVLNALEAMTLIRNAGPYLSVIDPAHYLPVGQYPALCYEADNIVCLNHYSHANLDDMKSPIDGCRISREEAEGWWTRILEGDPAQCARMKASGIRS